MQGEDVELREPVRGSTRPHEENEIVGASDPSGIVRDGLCQIAYAAAGSDGAFRGLDIMFGGLSTVERSQTRTLEVRLQGFLARSHTTARWSCWLS